MDLKHTPTPWETSDAFGPTEGGTCIKAAADDNMIASCTGYYGRATAIANAALIVRACNSHHQLVAALKDAKVLLELNGVDLKDEADYGNGEHAYQTVRRIHEALAAAGAV